MKKLLSLAVCCAGMFAMSSCHTTGTDCPVCAGGTAAGTCAKCGKSMSECKCACPHCGKPMSQCACKGHKH